MDGNSTERAIGYRSFGRVLIALQTPHRSQIDAFDDHRPRGVIERLFNTLRTDLELAPFETSAPQAEAIAGEVPQAHLCATPIHEDEKIATERGFAECLPDERG